MPKFLITYNDSDDGTPQEDICEFFDTVEDNGLKISAYAWAEDRAYALARKGSYKIRELK